MKTPIYFQDVETCVAEVIARVGKRITLGIPLGLGKPNYLVNAFYQKAKEDPDIHLTIMTALTLEKPKGSNELERRFLEPLVERVFGNYPDLDYIVALRKGELPANVKLVEFYFKPGAFLGSSAQQQNYISCNYTDVAGVFSNAGVNVIAQMISQKTINNQTYYSLSSNTDVTLDLLPLLREQQQQGTDILVIGQTNAHMPFMYRDAMVKPSGFDMLVDNPDYDFTLFGVPNMAVDTVDYMIGLYVSTLIRDGGTLQIGIGALGDAIAYACRLRHKENELYKTLLADLNILRDFADIIEQVGGTEIFKEGLYGSSEMFINGFWHLYRDGILTRQVYDNLPLQQLLYENKINGVVTPQTLDLLLEQGAIHAELSREDFDFLQRFGIFKEELRYEAGFIRVSETQQIAADLVRHKAQIIRYCLGERLKPGIVVHGGFFLGPQSLYSALKSMDEEASQAFCMTGVSYVNQLYGNEALKVLQRKQARFINTTMMTTLLGSAVSDGLENGQVISGVGGQYNFVAMAHALPGARSVLLLRSTRKKGTAVSSNMVWNYGHITIPRHLRDIVVTEYGIADLRGKSDKDIIAALLNISDSRFQAELLEQAKQAGKIPNDYQIPPAFRHNTPQRFASVRADYNKRGWFPDFPLGTDFTHEEIVLGKVLKRLKSNLGTANGLVKSVFKVMESLSVPEAAKPYLARLQLDNPITWKEQLMQKLIIAELSAGGYLHPANASQSTRHSGNGNAC